MCHAFFSAGAGEKMESILYEWNMAFILNQHCKSVHDIHKSTKLGGLKGGTMAVFTYHLLSTKFSTVLKSLIFPPNKGRIAGLEHMECMMSMTLGTPVISFSRMNTNHLAVFAKWENHEAIDRFLRETDLGRKLARGWYVRLAFDRRWGHIDEFGGLPEKLGKLKPSDPVVSVTLARMKLWQVPRFIRWGKPVEKLVRDHLGITLATAAMRLPRTVSTFSVWKTQREMLEMVHGSSAISEPERHAVAMKERERKDFHSQFTTLRFRLLSEHGEWQGRKNIVPIQSL